MRIWALPVAVCAVAGVIAWVSLGWHFGLVLIGVAAAGLAALYVGHQRAKRAQQQRDEGPQRRTAYRLRGAQRKGHRVLHACALPEGELDHLVVEPDGVHALLSRKFDRRIPITTKYGDLLHGPDSQVPLLDHARRQADQAARLLSDAIGRPIRVRPALVVYGARVPWKVLALRGVDVLPAARLRRYITRSRSRAAQRLSTAEIERLAEAADEALPARAEQPRRAYPGRRPQAGLVPRD